MTKQVLFAGLFGLCLSLGCGATQQWVKDYVSKENVAVKTEFRERLQPLEQGLTDNKTQVEALKKDVVTVVTKITALQGKLDDLSKSLGDLSQGYKTEVAGVRQDIGGEVRELQDKVNDLRDKLSKLSTGLLTIQKSIDLLTRKLEAQELAPLAPPAPPKK